MHVVGIGASAGAMDPLREFFSEVTAGSGLAFVVVQHLDPTHVSYMAGLLAKHTTMKVAEAQNQMAVQANCVYTIPPNKFLFIKDGVLHLTEPVKRDGLRMPIDFFFRSLADDQHDKAVAVLFSGSGSDGTLGIREIRGAGGVVFVQDPKTAQFDSMIENAIATGLVDYVLPVRQIPGRLFQYVEQGRIDATDDSETKTLEDDIHSILDLLVSETRTDFRCYKKTTIQRRIERRMGLNQIRDIADYTRFLRQNPDELANLAKDMLIGVTSFFRDAEAFGELRDKVIAPLVKERSNDNPIRVWVSGCATGEEVYSIVMLFREEMNRTRKNFTLQVYASDIDREALKHAREAIYSQSITADLSEERLARFLIKKDGTYQIAKQVREVVTFAEHNVITDPPFLRMDLISCRNLLIYIEPEIQKRVLNLFAFALKPLGYLFLGKSDTTIDDSNVFEPISRNFRIFLRKQSVALPVGNLPLRFGTPIRSDRLEEQHPIRLSDLNQQVLLAHLNAAIVLINEHGKIMHFYGPTNKYLTHPSGDANLNLFDMLENRYSLMLRLAVEKAVQENNSVKLTALDLNRDNLNESVDVTIKRIVEPGSGQRLLAVIFEPARTPLNIPLAIHQEINQQDVDTVAHLESENKRLKEQLQAAIESFQSTHEEFTAANEEVLAINEELQSANEELETSKEELQSVNEELTTVNTQLNEKLEELNKINDDLANFLNSSEVGTLFLDRAYCIRRFTPSTTKLLNLLPLDIGRPVGHISNKFVDVDLVSIADNVLKNLVSIEKEVHTSDGVWYMLRCLPYRTLSDVIEGVVFTFTDVSRLKHSEEAIMDARDYAENIIDTTREALIVLDPELKVVSANRAFYETFHTSPGATHRRLIYELGNRQWNIPKLREWLDKIISDSLQLENFEVEHDFPAIGRKIMFLNARRISDKKGGAVRLILLAIDDVTERREAEEERKKLEEQLLQSQKMESIGVLAGGVAHDFNNILNIIQGYASLLGKHATPGGEIAEIFEAISEATKRGTSVVQHLLTLARKNETKFELADANTILHGLSSLLKETFPKNIELTLDCAANLPPMMADPNQIAQALLNICVNARDAMSNGGRLTFTTAVVDRRSLQDFDGAKADHYVCIEVTDTGNGMDENVQKRIFEPFFTTKDIGQGTGLGLAVVYGIVKSHSGTIQVKSKLKGGTSFYLYVPVVPLGNKHGP